MANTKVSEMIEATEIKETDLLMIVQEGTNKKVKAEKIKGKILYENAEGTTENITINEAIENYKYFEIESYVLWINDKVYTNTGKIPIEGRNRIHLNSQFIGTGNILQTYCKRIKINGTTVTKESDRYYSETETSQEGNFTKITRIVGYK